MKQMGEKFNAEAELMIQTEKWTKQKMKKENGRKKLGDRTKAIRTSKKKRTKKCALTKR